MKKPSFATGFALTATGLVLNLALGAFAQSLFDNNLRMGLFGLGVVLVVAGLIIQLRAVGNRS